MSQVSITDVARAASVSASTVSRALQDHPRISRERREAIQALARRMGYRPSQVARSLVTGKTHTIGVVVTDVTDPFVAEVMKGAEAAGRASGYTLLFAMSNHDPLQELQAYEMLIERQVDAMIVISSRAADRYEELRHIDQAGSMGLVPLVLVNNAIGSPGVYSVRMDNRSGAREAVAFLHAQGHREIAFVAGPENGRSSQERADGFVEGMRAAGLEGSPGLIIPGGGRLHEGVTTLEEIRNHPRKPTAVLCYNDLAAIGLLAAAARTAVRVPADLSVIGYDNIPMSAYTAPPLTTVDQPKQQMGRRAVELCTSSLAGESVESAVLSGSLVVRESSAAPPQR